MKNRKKVMKLAVKNLDNIYKSSAMICKKWNTEAIPLKMLEIITDKAQLKGIVEDYDFKIEYNNLVQQIYKVCETQAKEMDSKSISIEFLKGIIIRVKKKMV